MFSCHSAGVRKHRAYGGRATWATLALTLVLVSATTATAARPYGWDASFWDWDLTPSEWTNIANQGYKFCYTKCTDGLTGRDWTFTINMDNGPGAGVYLGAFHFARPASNSAVDEADYFVAACGDYIRNGFLRPCLDLESGSSLGGAALTQWANDWMDRVEELTGVEPIIYTGGDYATNYLNSNIADRDLWIAYWPENPDEQNDEPDIGVFNNWIYWQFTDHGTITGLTGGALEKDINVYNGTLTELQNNLSLFIAGVNDPMPIYIVESRVKGQNYANYSETGTWYDTGSVSNKSHAPGCTGDPNATAQIGARYCSISGTAKTAVFSYTPTAGGTYEVYTTSYNSSSSGNPLVHKVTHAGGTATVNVCQRSTGNPNSCDKWYSLGQYTLNRNATYTVTLDGSTASGSAPSGGIGIADAIKWVGVSLNGPTITQQPSAASICPGYSAAFSVAASGNGTLTYQWRKNSANISNGGHYSGCTTATLTVSSADTSDDNYYSCAVTDNDGTRYSNQAKLTIKAYTAITTHPQNQAVGLGDPATFTVAATGDGTVTYQWQKNQTNISNGGHYSGCTTATLSITNADSNDDASYRCVATSTCDSAASNAATLDVSPCPTPSILNGGFEASTAPNPPAEWTTYVEPSKTATFTIQTSSPPQGSQWQQTQVSNTGAYAGVRQAITGVTNGSIYTISGAYKVNSVSATASVRYSLSGDTDRANSTALASTSSTNWATFNASITASGSSLMLFLDQRNGSSTSKTGCFDNIKVTITTCTVGMPSIVTQPSATSACAGGNAQFSVTASGDAPLTYQWQKNSANVNNGGHYSGCTTATLAITGVDTNDTANYRCVVTNSSGSATSDQAALTLKSATSITSHPTNQSAPTGGSASFSVAATGDGTLTYQWQKNSANISNGGHYSGCTTATLTVSTADTNDQANYRCIVTGNCGSATSNQASLTISACGTPSLTNGNFETGTAGSPPTGWTTYIQATKAGSWSIQTASPPQGTQWHQTQVYNVSSYGGIRQNVTGLTSGSVYTISGSYKTNSTSATASVRYNLSGNTDRANSTVLVSKYATSWSTFSADVTATGSSLMLFLDNLNGASSNKASGFDNIKVICKP